MGNLTLLERIEQVRDEATFVKDTKIETKRGSYDVWTEASILKSLRPLFKKYRMLPIREKIEPAYADSKSIKVIVTMKMYDLTGESEPITFTGLGGGFDSIDKDAGMASTYATKDAYLKLFTAVSGLDSDLNGSDVTDAQVRANAKNLLDQLWGKGHFHLKAAKLKGVDTSQEEWMNLVDADARIFYQKGATRIEESKIANVANDIHTMQELLK